MKSVIASAAKALPTLLGVCGGIALYVLFVQTRARALLVAVILVLFLLFAYGILLVGKKLVFRWPRFALLLIESWIFSVIILTASSTFVLLWIIPFLCSFLPLKGDELKSTSDMLAGAITAFVAMIWTGVGGNDGRIWPGGQFKEALNSTFSKNGRTPGADTQEYDAVYYDRVREPNGTCGWGFTARWRRANILSNFLKLEPMTRGAASSAASDGPPAAIVRQASEIKNPKPERESPLDNGSQ